jgi:hypothetical protein
MVNTVTAATNVPVRSQYPPLYVTFNHGVKGSSPSAPANENKHLAYFRRAQIAPGNIAGHIGYPIGGIVVAAYYKHRRS